jgi:hypothetical protein
METRAGCPSSSPLPNRGIDISSGAPTSSMANFLPEHQKSSPAVVSRSSELEQGVFFPDSLSPFSFLSPCISGASVGAVAQIYPLREEISRHVLATAGWHIHCPFKQPEDIMKGIS